MRHCLFTALETHAGVRLPRFSTPSPLPLLWATLSLTWRITWTLHDAIFVPRQWRGPLPKTPLPQPLPVATPLVVCRPPSEFARGPIHLPLAPPLLWPMSLPVVTLPARTVRPMVDLLRHREPSTRTQRTHRAMVRRRQSVAMHATAEPVAVMARCRYCDSRDDLEPCGIGEFLACPGCREAIGEAERRGVTSISVQKIHESTPDYNSMTVQQLRRLVPGSRTMRRSELLFYLGENQLPLKIIS